MTNQRLLYSLLINNFTFEEIIIFAYDYFVAAYNQEYPKTKDDYVWSILDQITTSTQLSTLLTWVKQHNHIAYENYIEETAQLTATEQELIIVAQQAKGQLHILDVQQEPSPWVRVGSKDFLDKNDPSVAPTYFAVLDRLVSKGYVIHVGGMLYQLTDIGWQVR